MCQNYDSDESWVWGSLAECLQLLLLSVTDAVVNF